MNNNILKNNIFSLHIDSTGLLRLGKTVNEIFNNFESVVENKFLNNQSTVLIPTYSYSYTNKETYDLKKSPSKVGYATEFLRSKNHLCRTADPIFSYLILGDLISDQHKNIRDYNCFGDDSIIAEMYEKNAVLCSVFAPWTRVFTELHYIEKKMAVKYRHDKVFRGITRGFDGKEHKTSVSFFCKNYEYGLRSGHSNLAKDLERDCVMKTINLENQLQIKGVFFKDLFDYVEQKIKKDYFYLCEKDPGAGKTNL